MAVASRSRVLAYRSPKPTRKTSTAKAEEDFLASVMVTVSASLEAMSEKEREQAVAAAEKAVAHLS
ncbi:MAG: hypothetical protein WAL75_12665 [Terracidiphilus sp.]